MKRTGIALIAAAALTVSGAVGATALTQEPATAQLATLSRTVPAASTVSDQIADDLQFAREEERMARDLYTALADKYDGARPFANIIRSEQTHYSAIGTLLTRYGIADPSAGKAAGSYSDPEIQKLYDSWLKRGLTSWSEALKVGIELEKRDIADLEKLSATAGLPSDVTQVYTNLLGGSRNHLAAFTRAAEGGSGPAAQGQGRQGQGRQGQGQGRQGQGQGRQGQGQGQGRQGQGRQGQGRQGQGQAQGRQGQGQGPGRQGQGQGRQGQGQGQGDCAMATPSAGRSS